MKWTFWNDRWTETREEFGKTVAVVAVGAPAATAPAARRSHVGWRWRRGRLGATQGASWFFPISVWWWRGGFLAFIINDDSRIAMSWVESRDRVGLRIYFLLLSFSFCFVGQEIGRWFWFFLCQCLSLSGRATVAVFNGDLLSFFLDCFFFFFFFFFFGFFWLPFLPSFTLSQLDDNWIWMANWIHGNVKTRLLFYKYGKLLLGESDALDQVFPLFFFFFYLYLRVWLSVRPSLFPSSFDSGTETDGGEGGGGTTKRQKKEKKMKIKRTSEGRGTSRSVLLVRFCFLPFLDIYWLFMAMWNHKWWWHLELVFVGIIDW